jgi:galactokinase
VTGERLTGAGWGGCAIAVGEFDALASAADSVCQDYEKIFRLRPRTWITRAAQGANLEHSPSRTS